MLTECAYEELRSLKDKILPGTFDIAKKYRRETCTHETLITAQECMRRRIGKKNKHKLCIATQDPELKEEFRKIPGVPLIYFYNNVLTLEDPSPASVNKSKRVLDI